jgi:2-oxoglutarate dehydrogenase E1 component
VHGLFVSEDDKATQIIAGFWEEYFDLPAMWAKLQEIREREEDENHRIYITGPPVLYAYFIEAVPQMIAALVASVLMIVLILWFEFRSWQGVVIPVFSGALSAIWGLGFAGLWGISLDPLVLVIPLLISARARHKMIEEGVGLDWSMGENLAFATLLNDGFRIRLSGQDVQRGTFSQRHAVIVDQQTGKFYTPLNHLYKDQQRKIEIINSMLSEEAVLGFEYGYTLAEPNTLTLWEAQFGDFANGALVVFDQFISSGERKWLRMSGLVCLLPHGYEGQGPEHSSARLERFLQMCAEDNMQIANCTTPANYFHILRRQLKRDIRKPLIMMTPKSLLRNKRATSKLEEFAEGTSFHRILWDDAETLKDPPIKLVADDKMRRVVMCSGKVYFDLYEEREKRGLTDIYLLRVEQLYPWPHKALIQELTRFKSAEFVWCQEEPMNMGAWTYAQPNIDRVLDYLKATNAKVRYAGRNPSASTATGLMSRHLKELKDFLEIALG